MSHSSAGTSLESRFLPFRTNIVGIDATIGTDGGRKLPLVYADWTASGRLYGPIERFMLEEVGPLVANTHTETTYTGRAMTCAYHDARATIKAAVGANSRDSLIFAGFGMTSAINKLQRLLGLKLPQGIPSRWAKGKKPLVLVTHMEHHSNQITWEECDVEVKIIPRDELTGLPDLVWQERILRESSDRPMLIGAFSACSNVTGLLTPYRRMAALMHNYKGVCFVDFAAAAPYIEIDMHPEDPEEALDAITFSPHKFLGGPGASGVLVMSNTLYNCTVPDSPGGGTVKWTTPFGTHRYVDDIESREDGGTPGFLQAMRAALAMKLKAAMGTEAMKEREEELKAIFLAEIGKEPGIRILDGANMNRLAIFSFNVPGEHYNLFVKLLDERFGIQTRGGCSCAGTYGHVLFGIDKCSSRHITDLIDSGDLSEKPGWVRVSLHPTMTDAEAHFIGSSIVKVFRNFKIWSESYDFDRASGEFSSKTAAQAVPRLLDSFQPLPKPAGL